MTEKWEQEFLKELEKVVGGLTDLNELVKEDGFPLLRSGFTLFEGSEVGVVVETLLEELLPNLTIVEIYMRIAQDLPDAIIGELEKTCLAFDYYSSFGSFGIDYEYNELYFKHSNTIDIEKSYETLMEEIVLQYSMMFTIIKNSYHVFDMICAGTITAEEAREKGILEL